MSIQIYLLAARPNKNVATVFRFHLNCMNGAVLALGFPELDALNVSSNLVDVSIKINILPWS